ncbi:unnamed protein product [Periconia digitata]|uniref:Uncharacterized protein n=1 Tax=Periconia digitata TaxID=1303443 RepID=A0A9W4UBL5_9PLEO|nr:unnamed protein product [Periconia digitata]
MLPDHINNHQILHPHANGNLLPHILHRLHHIDLHPPHDTVAYSLLYNDEISH